MKEPVKRSDNVHMRMSLSTGAKDPEAALLCSVLSSSSALCLQLHQKTGVAARCLWFGLSFIWNFAGCSSFKDTRERSAHSSFTQIVSSAGSSQQCWSLACPSSEPPSHLQLENLLPAYQGNSLVAQSSAFRDNLLSHWDWGTSRNIFIVDKKKKYPRVRMSQGTKKSRHKWSDHTESAHETERRGTGLQKSSIK